MDTEVEDHDDTYLCRRGEEETFLNSHHSHHCCQQWNYNFDLPSLCQLQSLVSLQVKRQVVRPAKAPVTVAAFERLGSGVLPGTRAD